jgi:hypothetical protein
MSKLEAIWEKRLEVEISAARSKSVTEVEAKWETFLQAETDKMNNALWWTIWIVL